MLTTYKFSVVLGMCATAYGAETKRCHGNGTCLDEEAVLLQARVRGQDKESALEAASGHQNRSMQEGCPGTFLGQDGTTYACQFAIDNGWAKNCAEVSTWQDATCRDSSCPGTFVGQDGTTYTCQSAIDNGWARDCAEVSTWNGATCSAAGSDNAEADIVIIGGGMVGCIVASQLAEKLPHKQIVLLEAGKPSHHALGGSSPPGNTQGQNWNVNAQSGYQYDPFTRYDVPGNYIGDMHCYDGSCEDAWGKITGGFYQCKVLGGCGVMNGALMQVPAPDMWASMPFGWQYEDMKTYIDRVIGDFTITPTPSADGKHYLDDAGANLLRKALHEEGFTDHTGIHVKPHTIGLPTVSVVHGERQSSASRYLPEALKRSNFKLITEAEVKRIIHNNGMATGVSYSKWGGNRKIMLKPGGKVVVSAGAFMTPRLLLLSGLDGSGRVGKGISDHGIKMRRYNVPGWPEGAWDTHNMRDPSVIDANLPQYTQSRSGPLAQYGPTLTGFFKVPGSPGDDRDHFDVEIFHNPMSKAHEIEVHFGLMRPTCSHEEIHLKADGNLGFSQGNGNDGLYFGCHQDRELLEYAIRKVDQALAKKGVTFKEEFGPWSFNHWVGTCAIGYCSDPGTLLVKGTSNVVVADASIVPRQIWAHPALSFMAVGHKASDLIANSFI
eukprot:TRINITY_DN7341_c0_g1_i4.p1 TRINITY_DN7341_c0_g1~~TRINITY_DN7341_c0_g1_i4.p1  ORF type:complete len:689 (-),score=110.68 TRINITY_DN7341_c0_g1_i4:236-2227(-)